MPLIGAYHKEPPCRGCEDRWVNEEGTCHSVCERYIEFKKAAVELNEAVRSERSKDRSNPWWDVKSSRQKNTLEKERRRKQ